MSDEEDVNDIDYVTEDFENLNVSNYGDEDDNYDRNYEDNDSNDYEKEDNHQETEESHEEDNHAEVENDDNHHDEDGAASGSKFDFFDYVHDDDDPFNVMKCCDPEFYSYDDYLNDFYERFADGQNDDDD
ncbi:prostatic spermine-binding protein-like [Leptopilina heterotoma]|uniref:prostatic spermine-binding protein-like n=1 Tax=Leptopilina heterotoma TaxID=63436 RepID=UPI001CA8D01B|nr:prostatic spermine-binding protein-like [Leptopilina heterotoma]